MAIRSSARSDAGVPSAWQSGFDRRIENLCAWHTQQEYLAARPLVARVAAELAADEVDLALLVPA